MEQWTQNSCIINLLHEITSIQYKEQLFWNYEKIMKQCLEKIDHCYYYIPFKYDMVCESAIVFIWRIETNKRNKPFRYMLELRNRISHFENLNNTYMSCLKSENAIGTLGSEIQEETKS